MSIVQTLQQAGPFVVSQQLEFDGVMGTFVASHDQRQYWATVMAIATSDLRNPNAWPRFEREASLLAHVPPGRLARLLDHGEDGGVSWAAYEYLEGAHLGNDVRERGLPPPDQAVGLMIHTLDALVELHAHGLAHRMLSPVSIFLESTGTVRLLHCGWCGVMLGAPDGPANEAFMSYLPFLAPEVAMGAEGDAASDVYSLGANLYFLLTGQPTHWAADPQSLIQMISSTPVDLEAVRAVAGETGVEVLSEMLEQDPENRTVNLAALRGRLFMLADALAASAPPPAPEADVAERQPQETIRVTPEIAAAASLARESAPAVPRQAEPAHHASTSPAPPPPLPPPPAPGAAKARPAASSSGGGSGKAFKIVIAVVVFLVAGCVGFGAITVVVSMFRSKPSTSAPVANVPDGGSTAPDNGHSATTAKTPGSGSATTGKPATGSPAGKPSLTPAQHVEQTNKTLTIIGGFHREYIRANGIWATKLSELSSVRAPASAMKDSWGRDFDLRESFVVSSGADGKWDSDDDLWIDAEKMELGSK